jgi:hypothetical protein
MNRDAPFLAFVPDNGFTFVLETEHQWTLRGRRVSFETRIWDPATSMTLVLPHSSLNSLRKCPPPPPQILNFGQGSVVDTSERIFSALVKIKSAYAELADEPQRFDS